MLQQVATLFTFVYPFFLKFIQICNLGLMQLSLGIPRERHKCITGFYGWLRLLTRIQLTGRKSTTICETIETIH